MAAKPFATEGSGRICAYCCLDHETHGGCFTGKRPSELRAAIAKALIAQAADTSARNVPAGEGQKQEPSSSRTNSGGTASPKSERGAGH